MKKIILIMCSVLLITGLFIGCDDDAVKEIYSSTTSPDTPPSSDSFTVTFEMNGHGTQISPYTDVPYGASRSLPDAPTAAYFIFAGWFYDVGLTEPVSTMEPFSVYNNMTLYARWWSE